MSAGEASSPPERTSASGASLRAEARTAEVEAGPGRIRLAAAVAGTVLVLDLVTKAVVTSRMALYESIPVLDDFFRLTYTHNPGAAFGIHIGEHSRLFFLVLALVALAVLGYLYRITPAWDRLRLLALSLVGGGAVGNIVDRIRYERGVVDFLDFGLGTYRWPVFNVADMAVSAGAVLLLVSFYREESRGGRRGEAAPPGG